MLGARLSPSNEISATRRQRDKILIVELNKGYFSIFKVKLYIY